ncbi:hypothetical protein [Asaccharospora irregularis]|uniref:Uncharacterized protein n=1 Tax=Asaccharospora irregularis DSM 2635 TaxID=1121321 RepID=A0A1M5SXF2_9FIRM|nr:hypothetical protein [Asaccharospora irregularis]SHH42908.1 hypothetical protein SAMN04488530_1485 [Asaccharospora irregularis DSM 2635]
MVIPIKTDVNITVDEMDVTETSFKSLNLKKSHIEEFIRSNIELFITDEFLLIIGSQITNSEKGEVLLLPLIKMEILFLSRLSVMLRILRPEKKS